MKNLSTLKYAVLLALCANAAHADDSLDERIAKLQKALQEQQWQMQAMAEELKALQAKPAVVTSEKDGMGMKSDNGDFTIKLHGLVQADDRMIETADTVSTPTNTTNTMDSNGWMIRKARPWIEGTLFGWVDYRLTPEFATTTSNVATSSNGTSVSGRTTLGTPEVIDAYFDAKFKPWAKLRVGKFKPFVSLARLQSDVDGKFLEHSFVSANLLPQRDVGAALFGDLLEGKLNYAVGYYNGVIDGGDQSVALDTNNDKEFSARVFAQPFKGDGSWLSGLGFGLAGTSIDQKGSKTSTQLPAYRSFSQLNFFSYNTDTFANGRRDRFSPQAYYYYGPFGLLTEYASEDQEVQNAKRQDTLTHEAWQATFSYLLTGEEASFGGVKPKSPFSPNKDGWGAWELVARMSAMYLDDDTFTGKTTATRYANIASSARKANAWGLGVNWYLNNYMRFALDYENTSFDGGGTGSKVSATTGQITKLVDRADERAMFGRLQVSF